MVRRSVSLGAALTALLLISTPAALSQAGQATLTGTVTDTTGALIPGAKAVLINEASKTERSTTADKAGTVNFIAVPPRHL